MPAPIELLLDPIAIAVFALYAGLMLWEARFPARPLPAVAGWKGRGLAAFAAYFFVSSYLPLVWSEHLARFQLLNLTALGNWGGALAGLCLTLVVGITSEAATIVLLAATFMAIFQHSNIRTPHWLGYIVQRPESHSRHDARGVHAGNYADLPLFDLLFGTFRNPRDFAPATGFYDGASSRLADMLRFRDVSAADEQAPQSHLAAVRAVGR
jgi:sterol desaturase/sphingolipid hydroxylase (fatty acid hydroxylase superfamily)